jgi:hypothetical protein
MKVNFSFVLLLALGAVIDPHVELPRTNVVVKSHEEAFVEFLPPECS